jgi:hypothetical protein
MHPNLFGCGEAGAYIIGAIKMADGNKKLRYIGLIIAIIALVVTIIIGLLSIPPPPPPDFSTSIDPMLGAIQAGGVIQTTISVMGINGYDHTVSLSASGQPPDSVISFVPPFGEAKPSYTSSVTINVDQNVPAGDYKITIKGTGADGKEHSCSYTLTVKPSVTPTPLVTPSPSPTPTVTPTSIATHPPTPPTTITSCIIDTMDSTSGWGTHKDDKGSSINIKSILGRTDNAIEISYDLKEWGWLVISKKINPEKLSEKEGIIFFYKGSGEPNTIELKLIYGDVGGTTFGVLWNRATIADNWVSIEVPYSHFDCWWPDDNCLRYGNKLDLANVRKIEFAISNKPEDGDMYGSGRVIIDDVQGICPNK